MIVQKGLKAHVPMLFEEKLCFGIEPMGKQAKVEASYEKSVYQ